MYHERGIRQPQIAAQLSLSQPRVSRMLKQASQLGIVRTVVNPPPGVYSDLEVSNKGVDISPAEHTDPDNPTQPAELDNYPRLVQLRPQLSVDRSLPIFTESLEVLTDHLESLGRH